ncbi:formate--tetrahydrofolate ligase [Candidatus Sumerlaeota bacterium]|nr:formate--tetrahydrofolate ligase [Candidatus Sumerlaeota bacterium]
MKKKHLSDLEIVQRATPLPIQEIAGKLAIPEEALHLYGKFMAKIPLDILDRFIDKPNGKYILVTCITPTPLGEGKTVNTIGLSMGLNKLGKTAVCCIRQPSMGPTFGIKGGAAGGGYSQVLPMEDFNLHFTGDFHAVTSAHNLLASFIDNSIHHKNPLNIDPRSVSWKRALDISDRALRQIITGLGGKTGGVPRETGFDITAASEVMTILSLTNGLKDLRERLSRILIGYTFDGKPVTAGDLQCAGAMTALLKDAIHPNLIQTLEHTPCFVHTGPFGNISTGNSSILADKIALKCAEYVVTESGFGADMGAEKFVNIKCHYSGLKPDAALLVCSVRALKMHGGLYVVKPGKPLPPGLLKENARDLGKGLSNLEKQIENILIYKIPVVVALNRFETDTETEINIVLEAARNAGAHAAVVSDAFAKGGEGALEMAAAISDAARNSSQFTPLYNQELPIKDKIETIARKIYGASRCIFTPLSEKQIDKFTQLGFQNFPVCMAKTHLSLSHNPEWKNKPEDFETPVQNVEAAAGAGYLYALLGDIMTMPGLPTVPAGTQVDIDEKGKIKGLF